MAMDAADEGLAVSSDTAPMVEGTETIVVATGDAPLEYLH